MSFVAYNGKHPRDPRRVLRVVQPDGAALHVIEADPVEAEEIARRTGGAVYQDRRQAIHDTLARTEAA